MRHARSILLLALAAVLCLGAHARAQTPTGPILVVTWDAPTTNTDGTPLTDLAGFRVYHGRTSRGSVVEPARHGTAPGTHRLGPDAAPYDTFVEASLAPHRAEITGYAVGDTVFLAATAYDTTGNESVFSTPEVVFTIPGLDILSPATTPPVCVPSVQYPLPGGVVVTVTVAACPAAPTP